MTSKIEIPETLVDDYMAAALLISGEPLALKYLQRLSRVENHQEAADALFSNPLRTSDWKEDFAVAESASARAEHFSIGFAASLLRVSEVPAIFAIGVLREFLSGKGGINFPRLKAVERTETLRLLVLEEIHKAFCIHSRRYKKELADLSHNAQLLIAAIAGYIAASVGVATAIVAALVAAMLRIALSMGMAVFCRRFQLEVLQLKSQSSSLKLVNKALKKLPTHQTKRRKRR